MRSNVTRLYLPRKEGGRGLISIGECVNKESKSLHGYLREAAEWMLQADLKEKVLHQEENLQAARIGGKRRKSGSGKRNTCMGSLCDKPHM